LNGKITTINPPGSSVTRINSINNNGEVAGDYSNSSAQNVGFTYLNGKITTIKIPGSSDTFVTLINNNGVVIGTYISDKQGISFMYGNTLKG